MTSLAARIRNDIIEQVKNNELVMPTLPEIALQVRSVAEDPQSSIQDLVQIVARDPALTARLIRITNSPLVRTARPVTDLTSAISRLGITYTCNLAVGLAMEQMFQATRDMVDKRLRQCWAHSLEIAASAQILAQHFTKLPSDQAMLAGLVHQIGMLPILTFAEQHDELLADSMTLDSLLEALHPTVGAYILNSWKFHPDIVKVPLEYRKFDRMVERPDYCDLVQVATLQSYANSAHPLSKIDRDQVGAFQRLGLVTDEEVHWEDIELSAADIVQSLS